MARLCVIPARGGSKRIPRKNIKLFKGFPIISYPIQHAIQSGLFDEVMVSTDDPEIAEIAIRYGASVPFMRSTKNAGDFSTTADVIIEVLQQYKVLGKEFSSTCILYPCTPLLKSGILLEAQKMLDSNSFDTVFSIIKYSTPIQRAFEKTGKAQLKMVYPEFGKTRSQDLPPRFYDAGQFYFLRNEQFLQTQIIFTENSGGIELSELEAQDIDNEIDWKIAELKYELLQSIK